MENPKAEQSTEDNTKAKANAHSTQEKKFSEHHSDPLFFMHLWQVRPINTVTSSPHWRHGVRRQSAQFSCLDPCGFPHFLHGE